MVDDAVEQSREGGLLERVSRYASGSEVDTNLEPRISYSESAVEDFVAELAGKINREAVDASLTPSGDRLSPEPGRKGFELQEAEMQELITEQVESPGRDEAVDARGQKTDSGDQPGRARQGVPDLPHHRPLELHPPPVQEPEAEARSTRSPSAQAATTRRAGLYDIQTKEVNPTWHVPDSDWAGSLAGQDIPPGPGNPLVARWMGIYDGAGIHGTDDIGLARARPPRTAASGWPSTT